MANATPDRSDHVPLELDLAADIAKVQLSAADFLRSEADGPGELSAHPLTVLLKAMLHATRFKNYERTIL
jgi:hypothetical protein